MARRKNHWLLIPFTIAFICVFWLQAGCQRNHPAEQAAKPAVENQQGTAKDAPAPTYVPVDESSIRAFETGTEYTITGKITTELMEGLPKATISVYGVPPRWSPPAFEQPAPLDTQTSDQEGRYQIKLQAPANLWARIRLDGYAQIDVYLPVRDLKTTVRDIQMQPAQATIAGLVYDKKDVPIAGALVVTNPPPRALLADAPVLSPIGRLADTSGKYVIEGLPEGDVTVIASAHGYAMKEAPGLIEAGQTEQMNFNLSPASPMSFAVKNSRGEALAYATATAPGQIRIAGADKRGVIEFSTPAELGPFECTVTAHGYESKTIQLDPKAPPAAVVLEDKPVVKGRVVAESGEAVAGALVSVLGTGGTQAKFDGAVRSDKIGRFEVPLSYPPAREIRVSSPGYLDQRLAFDNNKPAPPEVVVRVKRLDAGLYGHVIDYRGISVKRFIVHLRDAASKPGSQEYQRSYNSENGRFAVTDAAPGSYTLIIQSVPESTAEDVQLVRLDKVEIRKGFLFGEVLAQFPKPKYAK